MTKFENGMFSEGFPAGKTDGSSSGILTYFAPDLTRDRLIAAAFCYSGDTGEHDRMS